MVVKLRNKKSIPVSGMVGFGVPALKAIAHDGSYNDETRNNALNILRTRHGYDLIR